MRVTAFIVIAAIVLSVVPFAVQVSAVDANCATWAAEIGNPRDSYRMRQLGCNDSAVAGVYEASVGICARIARQGARTGLRGHANAVYVHAQMNRCYWDANQRAYAMTSTTW